MVTGSRGLCFTARTIEVCLYPGHDLYCLFTQKLRRTKIADVLLKQLGQPLFSWGSGANVVSANAVRTRYLGALRAADRGDRADLLAFVRS